MRALARFASMLAVCLAFAGAAQAATVVYPSAQTIMPTGPLPPGAAAQISLNAAAGEREAAWVVVTNATSVAASVDAAGLAPLTVRLRFAHFVQAGRLVPDALLPWNGDERSTEQRNQPLYVQIVVPRDAPAKVYNGAITILADGDAIEIPISVRVFAVTVPAQSRASGNLLTSFHVSPETYVNKAAAVYGMKTNQERLEANTSLFAFLSDYRIGPSSWGFGEPRTPEGYADNKRWWLDSAGNMARQVAAGGFASMRIPISSNRASARNRIAGLDPAAPDKWCDYLKSVRSFWATRGWLDDSVAYLYGVDEPGAEGQRLVGRQAKVVHECWPGSKVLMTGNPSPNGANEFLFDNKNGDDVDIWTILTRRYYGQFTTPGQNKAGKNRARQNLKAIERARARGKSIWSYTYSGVSGTPGFGALEPLSNPRMLLLWNALEGVSGLLYGQGSTNYGPGNPLDQVGSGGEFVLLYPGEKEPIASARLEQIRDGIEDWAIFDILRRKSGPGAVRAALGGAGLFSADAKGVKLGCNVSCELKTATKYSWPTWSSDASTARKIEAAKLKALQAAG